MSEFGNNKLEAPQKVNLTEATKIGFSKYATFSGRASRSEFWFFGLAYLIAVLTAITISLFDSTGILLIIVVVTYLAFIIPIIAVMVRRLHDIGKSGWWYWISLIPLGGIVVISFLCRKGDPGDNVYGPGS